ncbi:MAG: amidohydrolase family protein [Tissierellia bacterium]|nr:amidohydrolase family protein [Tissierellia bacterium]
MNAIPTRLVIKNGNLLHLEDGRISKNQTIYIESDHISKIQPSFENGEGAQIIDASDKYVIPGLINSHAHSFMEPYTWDRMSRLEDGIVKISVEVSKNLQKMLHSGITTCREMGSIDNIDIEFRELIKDKIFDGPDLICAGRPITPTSGHCWWFGVECTGVEEVRKAVREAVKKGSDFIKIMPTGGYMRTKMKVNHSIMKDSLTMRMDEIHAAVEEAHWLGLKVSAHCNGYTGVAACVEAGVDIIDHGQFAVIDRDIQLKTLEKMAHQGTWLVPTMSAYFKEFDQEIIETKYQAVIDSFRMAVESGVSIVLGNDSGVPWVGHDKIYLELKHMSSYGMTNLQALQSATLQPAKMLELEEEIGSIYPGKKANLLILDRNPLEDIGALESGFMVIKDGSVFDGIPNQS